MFEAVLPEAGLLKKILDSIKDLVTDCNFECSNKGITVQSMDSAHVSLVNLTLSADGFEFYRCDKNITLGINLTSLCKIVKCAGNNDRVTLRAKDSTDRLFVIFEINSKISSFELKLLDIENESLGIPDTDYECEVQLSASEFQKICRDLTMFGDTIIITTYSNGINFILDGENGRSTISISQRQDKEEDEDDNENFFSLQKKTKGSEVSLTFSIRYLNFFAKATSLSQTVNLSMAKDVPLVVEYKIENFGHVRYFLAPKIDDE